MRVNCKNELINASRATSFPQGGVHDALHLKGWPLESAVFVVVKNENKNKKQTNKKENRVHGRFSSSMFIIASVIR